MQIMFVAGHPCTQKGKVVSWLRPVVEAGGKSFQSFRWGEVALHVMEQHEESRRVRDTWERVKRFTSVIEAKDPLVVARAFVARVKGVPLPEILVVDGPKSRAQIDHVVAELKPEKSFVVWSHSSERERQLRAVCRKEPDDFFDVERSVLLEQIGLLGVRDVAEHVLDTSDSFHVYDGSDAKVHLTEQLVTQMSSIASRLLETDLSAVGYFAQLVQHLKVVTRETGSRHVVREFVLAA